MCGGKGSTGVQNQATQTTIPPEVLARYNQVYARGEQAANQPFQSYGGEFVAPINQTQQAGIQNIANAGQTYQPFINSAVGTLTPSINQASNLYGNSTGAAQPYNQGAAGLIGGMVGASSPLTGQQIGQYMNPYTQSVVNATTGWLNQQNQQQQNALNSDAIMSGAFGGDRSGIAKGVLSGQQNLANASTIAGLYNQNYAQGLAAAQQQQGQRVNALGNAATQTANLGNQVFGQNITAGQNFQNLGTAAAGAYSGLGQQAFNNQLAYGQAVLGAGTLQQQTEQAKNSALYNQFLQQQAYPFQTTQFLSNLATGTGALSGSGSQTYAYQPQPFFSDDKLKENVRTIGHTKDGLRIVRYNFKDDPHKVLRIGFLASDVEDKMPEAISRHAGVRAVDYERAARASGGGLRSFEDLQRQSDEDGNDVWSQLSPLSKPKDALEWISPAVRIGRLVGLAEGGAVSLGLMPRESYAQGGFDPLAFAQMLQAHQAMFPGAAGRAGVSGDSGPRGMQLHQGSRPQLLKAEHPKMMTQQEPGLRSTMRDVNDLSTAGKGIGDLYKVGKEAAVGTPEVLDKSGNVTTPASGGLLGRAGKWDPNQGWIARQTGSGTSGGVAAPGAGSTGGITSEPLPAPDTSTQAAGVAAPAPADLTTQTAGLMPDAADTATDVASSYGDLLDSSFFARRGGRAHRKDGGISGDIPYDPKDDGGYFPDDLDDPTDPAKLLAEQKGLAPPQSTQKSGSSGSDAAGIIGGLGSLAKLGMMFIKDGGRVGYDEGGDVDRWRRAATLGLIPGTKPVSELNVPAPIPAPEGPDSPSPFDPDSPEGIRARAREEQTGNQPQGVVPTTPALPEPTAVGPAPGVKSVPQAAPPAGSEAFNSAVERTLGHEGGYNARDANGAPVNMGINQAFNPDVDVRNLTRDQAKEIYRQRYWNAIGGDQLDPKIQALAFDTAVIAGPERAKQFLQQSAGDPAKFLQLRQEFEEGLLKSDPQRYGKYADAWRNRRGSYGDTSSLNAAPGVAPAGAPQDMTAGLLPQKPPEEPSWLDRNEKYIVPALSFLGNMLASPSRTLAGSIGSGIVGAAQAYPTQQRIGQEQQRIGIAQNQQYITIYNRLLEMANAQRIANGRVDPQLQAQILHYAQLIGGGSGGQGMPAGGPATGGGLVPTPATNEPAPAPPVAPPKAASQENVPTSMRAPEPDTNHPEFTAKLGDQYNPAKIVQNARGLTDPNMVRAEMNRAREIQERINQTGYGSGPNGEPVRIPNWDQVEQYRQRVANNPQRLTQLGEEDNRRRAVSESLRHITDVVKTFEPNMLAEFKADLSRFMTSAAGFTPKPFAQMNPEAYYTFLKEASGILSAQGLGAHTDQARETLRQAFTGPTLPPGAVRQVLSQMSGSIARDDDFYRDVQSNIRKSPGLDIPMRNVEFDRTHPLKNYTEKAYKDIPVRGDLPERFTPKNVDHAYVMTPHEVLQRYPKGAKTADGKPVDLGIIRQKLFDGQKGDEPRRFRIDKNGQIMPDNG